MSQADHGGDFDNGLTLQVQDTLTSVKEQPVSTSMLQLAGLLSVVLAVMAATQGAAWLLGASSDSPAALSSQPPEHLASLLQENKLLWRELNDTRASLEQGEFR